MWLKTLSKSFFLKYFTIVSIHKTFLTMPFIVKIQISNEMISKSIVFADFNACIDKHYKGKSKQTHFKLNSSRD